ncbi:FYVE, RhoGEF and PH domain-containing protein 3 [Neodiprion lecontei]|uniref:FYVE, RhoGEF and PH domain-containing protein 3 n=1 Tax=Neodiprion lecontei TaxID=441921 RepID=A0A6J0C5Z1_NEOLC|nr:FYVE, RhoGEF and PH domain-containing protein 3 [Neodiprion lecontei]
MNSPRTPQKTLSVELRNIINDRNILTTRTRMKVLSALDDINKESTIEREKNLRAQAVQEILMSEVAYLHQLELIMQFFMLPMNEKKIITHASYIALFGNIETIYNVNGELLRELKQDPDNVARAFYKLAPFFKLYSVYAYDYKQALMLLQGTQKNDQEVRNFIIKQETRPEVGRKLSSLLITPIQRIPRYRLLLKEVLQHTSTKDKDYKILQASLAEVEKAAAHINALVAEHEDMQKLLEFQKHINGTLNLVKPGRKLIRQGALMRVSRGGSASYRRHFVLLSDTLLYCKGDPESSLTVCCLLPLNKCTIQRVLSGGLFRVTCLQESLLLYSENGDSEDWIKSLQETVKKYIECRQTLRKDSSSRRPLRKNQINEFPSESIPTKRFKRKRSTEDKSVLEDPNLSTIIYINRDREGEGNNDDEGDCFWFRRFKRLRRNDTGNKEDRKSWMEKLIFKESKACNVEQETDPYLDSLYPLRYSNSDKPDIKQRNPIDLTTTAYSSGPRLRLNDCGDSLLTTNLDAIEEVPDSPTHIKKNLQSSGSSSTQNSPQQEWSSMKLVSQFILGVGSSLRDLFRLK